MPDFGKPVRIAELAHFLASAHNRGETPIRFTGLRPGEKVTEDLIGPGETAIGTIDGPLTVVETHCFRPRSALMPPRSFPRASPAAESKASSKRFSVWFRITCRTHFFAHANETLLCMQCFRQPAGAINSDERPATIEPSHTRH